jgi:O-antigen ligase
MPNLSRPVRAKVSQYPRGGSRSIAPTIRRAAGGAGLVLLLILLWLFVYQNLPTVLHGLKIKPVDTATAIDRVIKVGAIIVGSGVIAARWSLARSLAKNMNLGLVAFMVLAVLSAAWSVDSGSTLRRFVSLASIVLMCIGICLAGWSRHRFRQVAIPPVMSILVASLVLGMIYPDKVIHLGTDISQKDAWHGITYNKNQLGMTASVLIILFFHRWLTQRAGVIWSIAGMAVALTCLLLSRSSTSLLTSMMCMLFMVLWMRVPVIKQRYSTHVVVGLAGIILLYGLVILDVIPGVGTLMKPVMSLTGKDATFSSRSLVWEIIKEHIRAAPLLGTGYSAYWQPLPTPSSPSYVFMYLLFFYPTESHNGYLEVMNDLGIVGLICLLVYIVSFIRQALQLMRFDRSQAAMYLALLFQQMIANLSESDWFSRSTICIIFILATMCLSRELLEHRLRAKVAKSAGTNAIQ